MTDKTDLRVSAHARTDAAEWFVILQESPHAANREGFYNWLRKSPENVHAFLRITALWEDADLLELSPLFDREALIRHAQAEPDNITQLTSKGRDAAPQERRQPSRNRLALAASMLLVLAAGTLGTWLYTQRNTYTTAIGEQRTIALPDGSSIVLNSLSRAQVRYTAAARDVDLVSGQAIFRVAHNTQRPFTVHASRTAIRAVGTQFDVYRKSVSTQVTVLEGKVAVLPTDSQATAQSGHRTMFEAPLATGVPGEILLSAGEQLSVLPSNTHAVPARTDIEAATAWTQGKLIFNETPLSDVVAEFNRYSARRLVIDDPDLRDFHLSGVFPSSDPTRIAELLEQRFNVTVRESDEEIRVTKD